MVCTVSMSTERYVGHSIGHKDSWSQAFTHTVLITRYLLNILSLFTKLRGPGKTWFVDCTDR